MDFALQAWHLWTDNLSIRLFDHDHLWLHLLSHVVLVVMPTLFACIILWVLYRFIRRSFKARANKSTVEPPIFEAVPKHLLEFITRYSLRNQIYLAIGALLTLPVTYASLELPKRIINYALDTEAYNGSSNASTITQVDYLLFLCGLYLFVLAINGTLKFLVNYYKGSLSENLIRRLRLYIYQRSRPRLPTPPRPDIVPVIVQEVEPICGFSGDSFTVPLLHGGTALTIIGFMMMQNIALGAAAITLVPLQMLIIPRFQRRINQLVQKRISVIRNLSGHLSSTDTCSSGHVKTLFSNLQELRLNIFRSKFLSKAINNFIMNLTPFFFYTIGGYLVIEGKMSMGALVASLASYKDLASSIRELFAYYQAYQDSRVRYKEVYTFVQTC